MNRREFLGVTTVAGIGFLGGSCAGHPSAATSPSVPANLSAAATLKILPYPQEMVFGQGSLRIRKPKYQFTNPNSQTTRTATTSLNSYLAGNASGSLPIRLGSVEEGYNAAWLNQDENDFLNAPQTSGEASITKITRSGITVVGKGKWGLLYGVQTINQLVLQAVRENRNSIPCLTIRDWPDMRWRCLAPTLAWYSGWNRLEGYDICNWSEGEWKWLADWSLLHKCNAWAVCMYGYWPFDLPGYEKETLNVESDWFNPATNRKEKHRFVHRNIQREFYPQVIRYANERGMKVHAYIGKNSFNGRAFAHDAKIYSGGAAELLPFAPGGGGILGCVYRPDSGTGIQWLCV